MTLRLTTVILATLGGTLQESNELPPHSSSLSRPKPGALFLVGGGSMSDRMRQQFVERAGGDRAQLVVLATTEAANPAGDDALLEPWRELGPGSAAALGVPVGRTANAAALFAPLRTATGVWIAAGRTEGLAAPPLRDALGAELNALLQRGGVIGGSSDGAAILGPCRITGGGDRAEIGPGLGLLDGVVVEVNFLKWDRANRLMDALQGQPGVFGLGIDEGAAVVIEGRRLEVLGDSYVTLVWLAGADRPLRMDVLREGMDADLLAASRTAVARLHPPFPPAAPGPIEVPDGALVLAGGGDLPDAIFDRFVELAGGPDGTFVVVPTAMGEEAESDPLDSERLHRAGVKVVHVLHAATAEEVANSPALVALRQADGVWFTGGRQWRLVDVYRPTEAYELFHDVLRRGGVIGGTSAGASIQAGYLVRGHPLGNRVMMAEGYERGFDFLPGVAVDQHFTQRGRHPDLDGVVKRFPQLVGLGLDEGTAAIVQGHRLEVLGTHQVHVFDHRQGQDGVESLGSGEAYDLRHGHRED